MLIVFFFITFTSFFDFFSMFWLLKLNQYLLFPMSIITISFHMLIAIVCSSLSLFLSIFLGDFIYKVSSQSPVRHFIIHSRKALLNGLSPAENRTIPPLRYMFLSSYCFINWFSVAWCSLFHMYRTQSIFDISFAYDTNWPCRYEYYYALLRDFPDLQFTINGGILTIDEVIDNILPSFSKFCYFQSSLP